MERQRSAAFALALFIAARAAMADPTLAEPHEIHEIGEIIRMPRSLAARALPVRLRAVVTYADPVHRDFFMQSGRDAISMWHPNPTLRIVPGDVIEVSGVTGAGDFAPKVEPDPARTRIVGHAELPSPPPVTDADIANGTHDCRYMSLDGVVRTVRWRDGQLDVAVMTAFGRARVLVPQPVDDARAFSLLGSAVHVRGVMASDLDARAHFAGLRVYVQSLAGIERTIDATPDEDLPRRHLDELDRYDPGAHALGRVQTRGTVTLARGDGSFFFQDPSDGALVEPTLDAVVALGQGVVVTGFPTVRDGLTVITDAIVRPGQGEGLPPTPTLARFEQFVDPAFTGHVVRVRVELARVARSVAELILVARLADDDRFVELHLDAHEADRLPSGLEPGALLECTGVRIPIASAHRGIGWALVALRSRDDVVVVQHAPFWTLRRVYGALLLLLLAVAVAAALARWRMRRLARSRDLLEKRVTERTAELKRANDELRALDRMRIDFVSMAAHDLRSPLTVIKTAASVLSERGAVGARAPEGVVPMILGEVDRMKVIVDRFLRVQCAERRRFEPRRQRIDLVVAAKVVSERLSRTAGRKGQTLDIQCASPSVPVIGDAKLLGCVLDNLVDNACKYSPPGSRVVVEVLPATPTTRPRIRVVDCGPGLSTEDIAKLWRFGVTLSARPTDGEPSTGIGLALAKQWVDAMSGTLLYEAPDSGASFGVELPPSDASTRAQEEVAPPSGY